MICWDIILLLCKIKQKVTVNRKNIQPVHSHCQHCCGNSETTTNWCFSFTCWLLFFLSSLHENTSRKLSLKINLLNICNVLLLVDNLHIRIVKYFHKELKESVFCSIVSVLESCIFLSLVNLTCSGYLELSLPVSLQDL